jgi:hypothetical protein
MHACESHPAGSRCVPTGVAGLVQACCRIHDVVIECRRGQGALGGQAQELAVCDVDITQRHVRRQ